MKYRSFIIFVIGVAAGGLGAWLGTKNYYAEKESKRADDEIDEMAEYYTGLIKETVAVSDDEDCGTTVTELDDDDDSNVDDVVVTVPTGSLTDNMNRLKEEFKAKEEFERQPDRVRYDQISVGKDDLDEEPDNDYEEGEIVYDSDGKYPEPGDIHVISNVDFGEKFSYDRVSLYYYEKNKLLTDTDGHILDVPDLIGREALGRFGEFDHDIVYVRNDKLQTYYDVELKHEDYYEFPEDGGLL